MQWDEELYEVAREAAFNLLRDAYLSTEETHTLGHALAVLESMEEPAVQYSGREEVDLVRAGLSPDQAYHYRTSDGEEGTFQCKPERPGRDFPVSDGPNPHAVDPDGLFSARTPASVRSVGTLEKRIEKLMGRTEDLNGRIGGIDRRLEAFTQDVRNNLTLLGETGLIRRVEKLESMDTAATKQSVKDIADLMEALGDEIREHAVNGVAGTINDIVARLSPLERRLDSLGRHVRGVRQFGGSPLLDRVEHLEAHVETLVEWREEWEGPGE